MNDTGTTSTVIFPATSPPEKAEQESLVKIDTVLYIPDEDDIVVANGYLIDPNLTAKNLTQEQLKIFALQSIAQDGCKFTDRHSFIPGAVLVKGGAAWEDDSHQNNAKKVILFPAAVWTRSELLTPQECDEWIERGERLTFDDSDFIFKTGKNGFNNRMATGGRRNSATMLVEDPVFSATMLEKIRHKVPAVLTDGRKFIGLRNFFLVSRYQQGQYFAPHFDGSMCWEQPETKEKPQSAYTAVLYLSDNFQGGATHYLPGQGSEVSDHVAVQAPRGHAVIHRQLSVLHAAGQIKEETKYVMQFGLMYEPEQVPTVGPLRWGA